MSAKDILKIKKVLGKYNYWRKSLSLSSTPQKKVGISCQVACHSNPCNAEPTCKMD